MYYRGNTQTYMQDYFPLKMHQTEEVSLFSSPLDKPPMNSELCLQGSAALLLMNFASPAATFLRLCQSERPLLLLYLDA